MAKGKLLELVGEGLPAADQLELFVAELIDVSPKSDITSMEYPVFALSKQPDTETFRYENPASGAWIEILPSSAGRATIFDKDLLIYCISQLAEAMNRGRKTARRVRFNAYDYMTATGRDTSGREYRRIHDTLARLRGTTFKSNISANGELNQRGVVFGLIDDAEVNMANGRMTSIEVTVGERLYNSISDRRLLTYSRQYFELTSPNERRMYEICRKHCGRQPIWEISVDKLYDKFGTRGELREFRRTLKKMVASQPLPEYILDYHPRGKSGAPEKLVVEYDPDGKLKDFAQKTGT
jgi:plasmid replication initiation protein